ncbi:hypothetical protein GCM10009718_29590 [Isoptericola halotolerans]|uniref:Multiple sugar transport system substrate-binding protein/putative aldouronate transport system substrate-binding protein n=1 Tax=Isoptericola halotolerans TaxID=300560 RepID=A0ABX2A729_9MICO|nr:extracellular solute-binding protein [Isoptericola halotolerans]NOV97700.1 multiple sugar transport system substrate-binding protein/putative aldouronate transport system substrate-binding protein [Isoptericola halotolerans]
MKSRKAAAILVAPLVGALSLTACSGPGGENESTEAVSIDQDWSQADPITVDVFSGLANYMGIQSGWFGKIVEDKFNMELNIIAPNVAGGGDTLYNTRVSGGDLGDLVIVDKGQQMDELIQGGLLLDASRYYESMENVAPFDPAVEKLNEGSDGVYGFPTAVSTLLPTEPSEGLEPTFGAYLRWDLYGEIGYPDVSTLEDLLPVLQEMQRAQPEAENGQPTYAISLFGDWDGNMMVTAKQPATLYGYDELGFVLAAADGSDYQSIIDSDSEYVRALRFYFDANQMGLVDPESTTQNYDTMFSKYQNGQVLLAWWPWLGQSAYNTEERMAEGKGFELLPLDDQKVFSYGAEVYGGQQILGIGSGAEDPERLAAFIDWLYSPEGVMANSSQTMGSAGPEGLTWELGDDGEPALTDFGRQVFLEGGADVPAEWGGGAYEDGVSALNINTVLPKDVNPEIDSPYSYTYWPSYQESVANPLTEDWSSRVGGATTAMEYLETAGELIVAPGASYVAPPDGSEIEANRNQAKAAIIEHSWKMVFAKDEAEFESLLTSMQNTANGLGYEAVLEFDMANAQAQNESREAVAAEFG